jgi:hypothetical protein
MYMPSSSVVCTKYSLPLFDESERSRFGFLVVEHVYEVADGKWDSDIE